MYAGVFGVMVIVTIISWKYFHGVRNSKYINRFFSYFCKDPEIFDTGDFYWTEDFRNNYKEILEEINSHDKNISSYKNINKELSCDVEGWKILFLRVFNKDTKFAEKFPKTMKLINNCPCVTAYFSLLEPGTKIPPHVGIYKGVIRYHLGLIVPEKWEQCYINVNMKILHWREGQDLMFDDMFLHYVINNTNEKRLILFLDIKRNFHNPILNFINNIFLKFIMINETVNSIVEKTNTQA